MMNIVLHILLTWDDLIPNKCLSSSALMRLERHELLQVIGVEPITPADADLGQYGRSCKELDHVFEGLQVDERSPDALAHKYGPTRRTP